jgi:hypothetical protein
MITGSEFCARGLHPPAAFRISPATPPIGPGPSVKARRRGRLDPCWRPIRLNVVGTRVELALNDVVITTSDAIQAAEGDIGLQGENSRFEWRALKIRELPAK